MPYLLSLSEVLCLQTLSSRQQIGVHLTSKNHSIFSTWILAGISLTLLRKSKSTFQWKKWVIWHFMTRLQYNWLPGDHMDDEGLRAPACWWRGLHFLQHPLTITVLCSAPGSLWSWPGSVNAAWMYLNLYKHRCNKYKSLWRQIN